MKSAKSFGFRFGQEKVKQNKKLLLGAQTETKTFPSIRTTHSSSVGIHYKPIINQVSIMRFILIFFLLITMSCSDKNKSKKSTNVIQKTENLIAILDTIWQTEQTPITLRDSLINIYGAESKEADVYQKEYRTNHTINIKKIKKILDTHGWPEQTLIGDQGNRTIANVLQHTDQETREHYIPMMRKAVLDKKLEPRYLVRAEDRIATDKGELQIYGGQMKYYPETKSFNVWPILDPKNIDKRRTEIGLEPIAVFLKNRFDFEWNLEEQIKRTIQFKNEKRVNK